MGKKRRGHADIEDILARPWCYYCERDFKDLKLLISHQRAKHFKCEKCGRRLNTAGGLSVHLNQVHKEGLEHVENALPNRQGLEVEIFGMEGIPAEALDSHRHRLIQNFYQAQEDRRIATGNPLPGQSMGSKKKIKIETAEELKLRFAEWRVRRKAAIEAGESMDGVVATGSNSQQQVPTNAPLPAHPAQPAGQPFNYGSESIPTRPPSNLPAVSNLPQRPMGADATGDAEAGGSKPGKKEKDKKGKMVYDDAEFSPEERMAALPRYAFTPA